MLNSIILRDFLNEKYSSIELPAADVFRVNNGLVFRLELIGVKKDDVLISFEKGILSVSGKKNFDKIEGDLIFSEIRNGEFVRKFNIKEAIDEDLIEAEFESGVLKIFLPFSNKKEIKTISIK